MDPTGVQARLLAIRRTAVCPSYIHQLSVKGTETLIHYQIRSTLLSLAAAKLLRASILQTPIMKCMAVHCTVCLRIIAISARRQYRSTRSGLSGTGGEGDGSPQVGSALARRDSLPARRGDRAQAVATRREGRGEKRRREC